MIGYNTLYKSMNGIRVVSDGVSLISDGTANFNDIIYDNTIKSEDGKTILNNNNINTEDVYCLKLNCDNLETTDINSNNINCNYFKVSNSTGIDIFKVDGILNDMIYTYKEMEFNKNLNVVNSTIHQTQTGILYQQGTGENYLKDTKINGYLTLTSNLTQTGGSTELNTLTVDTITQNPNKGITQSGNVSNNLAGTTQMKNLIITDSVIFPSNVEIPQTTTSDDILMNGDSVITQDITTITTKFNNFRDTRTLNLFVDGDITNIRGNSTTTLKNTIIQGLSTLQGDITQTSGTTILKTLRCNNITLNDDQIITLSGTGYITQSGTGKNTFKTIDMTTNSNINQSGGILSQTLGGVNSFSHFRSLGIGIISGKNSTGTTHTYNCHTVFGLQFQYGRTNDNHCYIMSNRATGANGAIRFQRYVGSVYLDEPLVIDDTITMNKNLIIPAGSLSCSSATIGIISQDELNCLENINYNIKDKFISLDEQINNLSVANNNSSLALTGISYTSANDTTTIDNNLIVNKNTTLTNLFSTFAKIDNTIAAKNDLRFIDVVSKNESIFTQLYHANAKTTIINHSLNGNIGLLFKNVDNTGLIESVNFTRDNTQINNNLLIGSTNVLTTLNDNSNNINNLLTNTTGITYNYIDDDTIIDNNLIVNKNLIVQDMNIKNEIENIKATYTTGTITTGDLVADNLTTTNIITNNLSTVSLTSDNITATTTNFTSVKASEADIRSFKNYMEMLGSVNFKETCIFDKTVEIKETLTVDKPITYKKSLILGSSKNINSSLTLTFPLSEYNIINLVQAGQPNINVSLPAITAVNRDVSTTFFSVVSNVSCFIAATPPSKLYDLDKNEIVSIVLNSAFNQSIKFHSYGDHWYIIDILNTNNPIYTNMNVSNQLTTFRTTTGILEANSLNTNMTVPPNVNIIKREIVAGYLLDGNQTTGRFNSYPIFSSMKFINVEDTDDAWLINPGYKFVCYSNYYSGTTQTFDNTNGTQPRYYQSNPINTISSVKVYYLETEITYPNIS